MSVIIEKKIMKELEAIKKDLNHIKEHMIDRDTILTSEEEKILDETLKEFKEGKAIKLEELESEVHGS